MYTRHYQRTALVDARPQDLFEHLDDPGRFAGHMSSSSWLMAGGRMGIETDEAKGRSVGSHIRLGGKVMGRRLYVDEVVTQRAPPENKTWETVGRPELLVISKYRMGFAITPQERKSQLRVFIDYALPAAGWARWLGRLLGGWYARWCTRRVVDDTVRYFAVSHAIERPASGT